MSLQYNATPPTLADGATLEQLQVDTSGNLKVNIVTGGSSGGATSANQTNGSQKTQVVDGGGAVLGAAKTPTNATTLATNISKTGARNLISGSGRIDSTGTTGTYFLLFLDANGLPANGAVTMIAPPQKVVHASGADDPWTFECPQGGVAVANGVVIALSTTEFTLTVAGSFLSGGIATT